MPPLRFTTPNCATVDPAERLLLVMLIVPLLVHSPLTKTAVGDHRPGLIQLGLLM